MDTLDDVLEHKGRKVLTIPPRATVFQAVELMCNSRVGALLVCVDDAPIGMFTERDLMERVILARRDVATTPVEQVMTTDVVCVDGSTHVRAAMGIMTDQRVRHLPVVEDGHVVGLISIGDLVRWISLEQEFQLQIMTEYVVGGGSAP